MATHPKLTPDLFRSERLCERQIVACEKCPRLVQFLRSHRAENPDWWCRPVPGFGDPEARLIILGLAPGLKGANRTGRPFTGDAAGIWLYRTLHEKGLCNRSEAERLGDGLGLRGVYIANAVKCVPPGNKPLGLEVENCRPHLQAELKLLPRARVLLCLGRVAHDACFAARKASGEFAHRRDFEFAHGAVHRLSAAPELVVDSYHPSRQNTNTGRLTLEMWDSVVKTAITLAEAR